MLVHSDIARLPVRDERNDGVLDAPYVLNVESDTSILVKAVDDDEPGFHEVDRSGDAAVVSLSDGHTEPSIGCEVLDQAVSEWHTEPTERNIGG